MNNKEFIVAISKETGSSQEAAQQRVNDLLAVMEKIWQENDSVSVSGFGVMDVKKKKERISVTLKLAKGCLFPQNWSYRTNRAQCLKKKSNRLLP